MSRAAIGVCLSVVISATTALPAASAATLQAVLETTMGAIRLELYEQDRPVTVQNFAQYVNEGFYDGDDGLGATIFHRATAGFVIQGGAYTVGLQQKATHAPIVNESDPNHLNKRGTIAMARPQDPNSADNATAQFFINVADNSWLDWTLDDPGYAVFGQVVEGMDIVDAIAAVETTEPDDLPVQPIIITDAYLVPEPGSLCLALCGMALLRSRR